MSRRVLDDAKRGCWVDLYQWFISTNYAAILQEFFKTAPFEAERVSGPWGTKTVARKSCAFGDYGTSYGYSGVFRVANPWPEVFKPLLSDLREHGQFNYVLCNLYPDGSSGLGWHSDYEPQLDHKSTIASLSLGSTRDFCFRLGTSGGAVVTEPLKDCDLLVMGGETQRWYQHSLPERKRVLAPRINLTFRRVKT